VDAAYDRQALSFNALAVNPGELFLEISKQNILDIKQRNKAVDSSISSRKKMYALINLIVEIRIKT